MGGLTSASRGLEVTQQKPGRSAQGKRAGARLLPGGLAAEAGGSVINEYVGLLLKTPEKKVPLNTRKYKALTFLLQSLPHLLWCILFPI